MQLAVGLALNTCLQLKVQLQSFTIQSAVQKSVSFWLKSGSFGDDHISVIPETKIVLFPISLNISGKPTTVFFINFEVNRYRFERIQMVSTMARLWDVFRSR